MDGSAATDAGNTGRGIGSKEHPPACWRSGVPGCWCSGACVHGGCW